MPAVSQDLSHARALSDSSLRLFGCLFPPAQHCLISYLPTICLFMSPLPSLAISGRLWPYLLQRMPPLLFHLSTHCAVVVVVLMLRPLPRSVPFLVLVGLFLSSLFSRSLSLPLPFDDLWSSFVFVAISVPSPLSYPWPLSARSEYRNLFRRDHRAAGVRLHRLRRRLPQLPSGVQQGRVGRRTGRRSRRLRSHRHCRHLAMAGVLDTGRCPSWSKRIAFLHFPISVCSFHIRSSSVSLDCGELVWHTGSIA